MARLEPAMSSWLCLTNNNRELCQNNSYVIRMLLALFQVTSVNLDWWTSNYFMPVLVGVTVWIVCTFASPLAKSFMIGIYRRVIIGLGVVTLKTVGSRMRQAEVEYHDVVELRKDPARMASLVIGSLMPLCFCLVIVVLPTFYSVGTKTDLPQWLFSALAGVVGVGFRWFLEAMSAFNLVSLASDFAQYEARYLKQHKDLNEIYDKLARGLNKDS